MDLNSPRDGELQTGPRGVTRHLAATGRWTFYGLIVGVVAGLGSVLFQLALQAVSEHILQPARLQSSHE